MLRPPTKFRLFLLCICGLLLTGCADRLTGPEAERVFDAFGDPEFGLIGIDPRSLVVRVGAEGDLARLLRYAGTPVRLELDGRRRDYVAAVIEYHYAGARPEEDGCPATRWRTLVMIPAREALPGVVLAGNEFSTDLNGLVALCFGSMNRRGSMAHLVSISEEDRFAFAGSGLGDVGEGARIGSCHFIEPQGLAGLRMSRGIECEAARYRVRLDARFPSARWHGEQPDHLRLESVEVVGARLIVHCAEVTWSLDDEYCGLRASNWAEWWNSRMTR